MGNEQQKVDGVIDTTGFPVPPAEQNLPAMWAEHVCDVGEGGGILEGLCFDRTGILWFVDCPHALIYRLDSADPAPKPEVAFKMPEGGLPSAVKIHKDGRLFITCVMSDRGPGIFVMSTEGAVLDCISAGERWCSSPMATCSTPRLTVRWARQRPVSTMSMCIRVRPPAWHPA